METIAFLYKWTQISTGKWYVGSRTSKGCHPNDGYICSSKVVKPLILEHQTDWERSILVIGNPTYISQLERLYLKSIDAKNDPLSFNRHNGDGVFSQTGKIPWNKDKTGVQANTRRGQKCSPESKEKMSKSKIGNVPWNKNVKTSIIPWNKGIKESDEIRQRKKIAAQNKVMSQNSINALVKSAKERIGKPSATKGMKLSPEHGKKISAYQTGRVKVKNVCRIIDKKEMSLSHYNQWINRLNNK